MAKVKVIVLLLVLVLLMIPQAVMAQTSTTASVANGEIQGTLVNGTSGGGSAGNLAVQLAVYQGNNEQAGQTTQSDQDGKFTFTGIPTDSTYSYQVIAVYQQVEYSSPPFGFDAGKTTKSIELQVFEPTTESVPVSTMLSHAILDYANGLIVVKEYYYIVNGSDHTYLGAVVDSASGRRETLKLSLPTGATEFQAFYGLSNNLVKSGSDVSFLAPLFPGTNEIVYVYSLPNESDNYSITWNVNYDTNRFDLLIPNERIQASSAKLTKGPSLTIGGKVYQDYAGDKLVTGDKMSVQLSGLLGAGKTAGTGENSLVGFAWLAIIPVGAVVAVVFWQRRKKLQPVTAINSSEMVRQKLLAEIAELDDKYEDGAINKEEYTRLRAEKKQQLLSESQSSIEN